MKETKERNFVPYPRFFEAGRASDYIKHAPDELKPGDRVILCCRVSGCTQNHAGNLADSEANLTERAKQLGVKIIAVKKHVGSGTDPYWLAWAVWFAKQNGAKLFAETTDRFIRHPAYHSKHNPNLQARDIDLQDLQSWTNGVTLVTDLHPDASPETTRSYQRKRGQVCKCNRGGRPTKPKWTQRRKAWLPLAMKMRDAGLSYRQIADLLNARGDGYQNVSPMTVCNWLK